MFKSSTINSPVGLLTLTASDAGLRKLVFDTEDSNDLSTNDPEHPILRQAAIELDQFFNNQRTEFTVPLDLVGTDFQKLVWQQLQKIPFGMTISYSEQSLRMDNPRAIRAIASANGKNPIPIIVPCHRVIGKNGDLQGYSGGLDRKRKLLQIENSI